MIRPIRVLIGLFLLLGVAGPGQPAWGADARIMRVANGSLIDLHTLANELKGVRLVFIGELHDHPGHHRAQLSIIEALRETGTPLAVGLEMFRHEDQAALDRWVAGKMPERDFVKVFDRNWGMWPLYRKIFLYARAERIPLVGLNLPKRISRQVARGGFRSLSSAQRQTIPRVSCDVDASYQDFIHRTLGDHVGGHQGSFVHFCEAQMLWDNVMALNLIDFLAAHPHETVVVLTGGGHAWKYGIPEQIRRRKPYTFRVILPEAPGLIDHATITPAEADYLLIGVDEGPLR
jgi:uncharacterized iron-regulated protein